MKTLVAAVSMVLCAAGAAEGATWYVDDSVAASGDGKTAATAFRTIQSGIDAAFDGDTVIAAEGTYRENVNFKGKNIVLTSTDPLDSTVVANTIIDGRQSGSVVTFSGTENEACVLSGFTIRGGNVEDEDAGGGICGGTEEVRTRATIRNNLITGNVALSHWELLLARGGGIAHCDGTIQENSISGNIGERGGGLYECDGTIQNNRVCENSGSSGGGLYGCDGTIRSNVITWNSCEQSGGALAHCDGTVEDNTIIHNTTGDSGGGLAYCDAVVRNNRISWNSAGDAGGGLAYCDALVRNNVVSGNSADRGGGLCFCHGIIENNLISCSASSGGALSDCDGIIQNNMIAGTARGSLAPGLYHCKGTIRNCVIWVEAGAGGRGQVRECSTPSFSCIRDWAEGGRGNIAEDPRFVDPDGADDDPATHEDNDYHLSPDSPCIDAGVDYHWSVWPQRDVDGNCRVAGDRIDMGCFEYGSSPDSDGDLLSDADELQPGTDPAREDSDGDGLRDGLEILRGSDPLAGTLPGMLHVPWGLPAIQAALLVSLDGDEIVVAPATYRENLEFAGRDLVVRSLDPDDPAVVASTVVDGGAVGPVVRFTGGETEGCVLAGFTIENGLADYGAGICGGEADRRTRATINNNIIRANETVYGWPYQGWGGGIAYCDGVILSNTITGNSVRKYGGGLAYCGGTIRGNVIAGNRATNGSLGGQGGGLYDCDGTIERNTVSGNYSSSSGGGFYGCDGIIERNVVSGNYSYSSGGGFYGCDGIIRGNIIAGNGVSAGGGGGLDWCNGAIHSNTIVGNHGPSDRALSSCQGVILNCIIWGGTPDGDALLSAVSDVRYCCIQGWTGGGEGNIAEDPRFVDPAGPDNDTKTYADNDYHLRPDSPCVDAGTHTIIAPPNTDMDGEWRPFAEEIDIGADECIDADADGLADYWEIDWFGTLWLEAEDDVDGDGLSNGEEFARGTDPCERDSDEDGKSDGDEVFAGTDPRDPTSLFRIVEIVYTPWGAAVKWSAAPMRSYRCYLSSGLKQWHTAGGIITAGPSDTSLSLFDWGSVTARTSYYKVEVLP